MANENFDLAAQAQAIRQILNQPAAWRHLGSATVRQAEEAEQTLLALVALREKLKLVEDEEEEESAADQLLQILRIPRS